MIDTATGRITRLLVADVSGHGEVVCALAGELRDLMRKYVNYLDQGQFVRSMNERFLRLSTHGCFATAVVTTFFAPTNHLSLCNAGHPPPLIYRAAAKRLARSSIRARRRLFSAPASPARGRAGGTAMSTARTSRATSRWGFST